MCVKKQCSQKNVVCCFRFLNKIAKNRTLYVCYVTYIMYLLLEMKTPRGTQRQNAPTFQQISSVKGVSLLTSTEYIFIIQAAT